MRVPIHLLGTLVLSAGLLVGCGGDEDTQEALLEADDDDAGIEIDVDDDDDGSVLGLDGDDEDDFCRKAEEVRDRFSAVITADEPDAEQFRETSDAFSDLADDAPDVIQDDMVLLGEALGALADVFGDVDLTDPEATAALEDDFERVQAAYPNVDESSDNVEAYFRDECGVDLNDLEGDGLDTETETETVTETETDTETETES